ncbi:hypothetical protein ACFPYI_00540 [Halomarina salina]|uniref:Uncharacterized protein n=1 Tax=Halomarina salina TaxID=1872699 RepID=A0ABD5RGX5_9EURY|nr:hypothetical protein [Halomarina salina]
MDAPHSPPTVTTEAELVEQFNELIESAHRHGVDVEGAWACRDTDAWMDYELLVSAVRPVTFG